MFNCMCVISVCNMNVPLCVCFFEVLINVIFNILYLWSHHCTDTNIQCTASHVQTMVVLIN